jgi:hypothetical protein
MGTLVAAKADHLLGRLRAFGDLVVLSLLEPLRDKVAYFWSLVQPLFGIVFVAVSTGELRLQAYDLGRFAIYVCFVNSLYTTGVTMLWKRESGLLRGFVRTPAARARLVGVHIASSALYAAGFSVLLLGLLGLVNRAPLPVSIYLGVVPAGLLASVLASIGSMSLLRCSLSVGNATAVLNIFAFLLAVLTFFIPPTATMFGWMQLFNPVSLLAAALYHPLDDGLALVVWTAGLAWVAALLLIGAAGCLGLRPRPSNLR